MLAIITSHPIQYQAPLWRALAQAGVKFEVWFLTPHAVEASYDPEFGRSFAWDLDLLEGYPHRFLAIKPDWRIDTFNGIRPVRSWREEFKAHGVTRLWVEGWRFRCLWQAVFAARSSGVEVWLRGENHALAPESAWRGLWKRPLLRLLFSQVDFFLWIGGANRDFYRLHGVAVSKLRSAPYCVDNARFTRAAETLRPRREELRTGWGIAPDAFVVLFCGKLIAKKRPLDLLAAVTKTAACSPRPLHLLVVGDGELAENLKIGLAVPGAPAGTLAGFLNQMRIAEAFAAADCLVLPSDYGETWGLVVNEALASGLPAIISDRCGCAGDLGPGQGVAHVFPCGNIEALSRALLQVINRPPAAETLRSLIDTHAPARTVETVIHLLAAR
ncbi:MAG: glycosyltransferase family 4 protein [Verrucomicrobia bacterium]|nr:glycosyltransferase family 4 protein [Verrucomicrobiota bacterium]